MWFSVILPPPDKPPNTRYTPPSSCRRPCSLSPAPSRTWSRTSAPIWHMHGGTHRLGIWHALACSCCSPQYDEAPSRMPRGLIVTWRACSPRSGREASCWQLLERDNLLIFRTSARATRDPGGWGRRHTPLTRHPTPEDRARTQRWRTRAESALHRRSPLLWPFGRIGRKFTTRQPSVPDSTSRHPPDRGERPACTSMPGEAHPAGREEQLQVRRNVWMVVFSVHSCCGGRRRGLAC